MQETAEAVVSQLHLIDYVIVIVYMAGVLVLGTYFGRYVHDAGDFFTAGKALPFWAIGMSIVVSDIGATDFMALAGAGYQYGITAANFDWIGSMPAMALAAFFFIPYYWRSGVYTIPEFLGRRYNVIVQVLHGGIWGIYLVTMLAVMLWMTALLLQTNLGWDTTVSIWIVVAITGIYTFSGGLSAVVLTDVVQLIVMFVGGTALVVLSLWDVGGWDSLREQVLAKGPEYQNHFELLLPHDTTTPYPWTGIVFGLGLVISTAYMAGNQAIVQRTLGARSEWDAKGGMLFAGFLKVFIPLMIVVPGLAAIVLLDQPVEKPDTAVPTLIRDLLPPGLTGLMFAALFAALMSSVDSYLNSASTIWTTDLYGRFVRMFSRRPISPRHGLIVGRVFTVVFIVLAGFVAPAMQNQESMYTFVQTALSMFQGPVLAILLLGILWRGATQWGGLAGLVLGIAFTTILNNVEGVFPSEDPFLFVAWWSFVFSLIVTIIVSLVTPKEPEEKIRGLVFGQVMHDGELQRILQVRAENASETR